MRLTNSPGLRFTPQGKWFLHLLNSVLENNDLSHRLRRPPTSPSLRKKGVRSPRRFGTCQRRPSVQLSASITTRALGRPTSSSSPAITSPKPKKQSHHPFQDGIPLNDMDGVPSRDCLESPIQGDSPRSASKYRWNGSMMSPGYCRYHDHQDTRIIQHGLYLRVEVLRKAESEFGGDLHVYHVPSPILS